MNELTSKIKKTAIEVGFDKIGVSPALQPPKSKYLQEWLKRKYHGSMKWLSTNKDKRTDILKLFPQAKSIISVAYNYFTPYKHSSLNSIAKISRYAWGEDYHKIMKKKLKLLMQKIKQLDPEIKGQICVDTAPIMEKIWAEQCGIGWQGKHTNIITRDFGSWLFLGEIILDKELKYDQPTGNFCGSCDACIRACPTEAIVAPYIVDARKCIAYLTIEMWNKPIPDKMRSKMNNWIFGCDICQDVCPWNKFSRLTSESRFYPESENLNPDINKWRDMNELTYKNKFKKSPLARPGYKNFLRNISSVIFK
jgi:epoxyqueuosine reductase